MTRTGTATVTISRTRLHPITDSEPFMALTVVLRGAGDHEGWEVTTAIDEDGDPVTLTETETLLARCLAAAGVDETGV